MLFRPLLACAGLATVLVPSSFAEATVVIPRTIEQMAEEATAVVHAVVRARQSTWDEEHKRIYTYTELERLDAWAGTPGASFVVRTLGGEVGKIGMKVSGTPRFELNEEVVVFLRADPLDAERFQVVGMAQGKLRVAPGPTGAVVRPDVRGLAFATPGKDGRLAVRGPAAEASMTLEALRARVLAARTRTDQSAPSAPAPPLAPPAPTAPGPPAEDPR